MLSGVARDSAKKQTTGDAEGGLQKHRGPRIIDTKEYILAKHFDHR